MEAEEEEEERLSRKSGGSDGESSTQAGGEISPEGASPTASPKDVAPSAPKKKLLPVAQGPRPFRTPDSWKIECEETAEYAPWKKQTFEEEVGPKPSAASSKWGAWGLGASDEVPAKEEPLSPRKPAKPIARDDAYMPLFLWTVVKEQANDEEDTNAPHFVPEEVLPQQTNTPAFPPVEATFKSNEWNACGGGGFQVVPPPVAAQWGGWGMPAECSVPQNNSVDNRWGEWGKDVTAN